MVGDLVVLSRPTNESLKGREVEIIKEEDYYFSRTKKPIKAYGISLVGEPETLFIATEDQLDRLPHPNTPASWEDCAWKPKKP